MVPILSHSGLISVQFMTLALANWTIGFHLCCWNMWTGSRSSQTSMGFTRRSQRRTTSKPLVSGKNVMSQNEHVNTRALSHRRSTTRSLVFTYPASSWNA
ncbi:hypothetical protein BJX66DRAFT_147616 [Aspergillus keveii]|uniref:Secreted protein n=1 Tax=Aspergillus keveii TaxID=714993 RepID=A0ABR4FI52_9EURO